MMVVALCASSDDSIIVDAVAALQHSMSALASEARKADRSYAKTRQCRIAMAEDKLSF